MTQPKPYRVLVTGSRDWTDRAVIHNALSLYTSADELRQPLTIVHGHCPTGADAIADMWCLTRRVTVERHPAKGHPTQDFGPWPGAGPRRNAHMVSLGADVCLAFLSPCTSSRCRRTGFHYSHGAGSCARLAAAAGITVKPIYASPKDQS
ncbi:SLOG family protein [Streptomyces sp. SP18ES09]|uniref:SLOG family protein n=1 Tax=Streptomyces sp. SP18ES09 TaxID=3002532 RepID=UPI002E796F1A|nr:SLOG family protein [Streptomyces sp. SP18ES09]MEE1814241.1 SLOG family protein [Streptomyces sp. SP18ES09]